MATVNIKFIGLACLLCVTVATRSECFYDYIQMKSVCQAQKECVRLLGIPCARLAVYSKHIYPNDTETKCMVRCMGLNLGWWNDTNGVHKPAMRNLFHPDIDDYDYEHRTYHCLKSQQLDNPTLHLDACERAYESFRCYYEQYGNIVVTPQFVPHSALQQLDVLHQCANMLQIPLVVSDACYETKSPSERDIGCLLRCFLLKCGLYNEQHGPNLDRLYVQCNNYVNETQFRETTGACFQQLKTECQDECVLVSRFLQECFYEGGVLNPGLVAPLSLIESLIEIIVGMIVPIRLTASIA